jgi:hypothetical protein
MLDTDMDRTIGPSSEVAFGHGRAGKVAPKEPSDTGCNEKTANDHDGELILVRRDQ